MQMRHTCAHTQVWNRGQPNLCARVDRTHRSLGNVEHGGSDGDLFNGRRKGRTTHCCRRRHRRRRAHAHAEHHQHHDHLAEEVRRKDSIGCETVETKDCSLEHKCILHAGGAPFSLFLARPFFFRAFQTGIQIFPGNAAWTIQPRSLVFSASPQAWACHSPS